MMLPGSTISPPNFLTPSRFPALSRPLRDDPPAFLCATSNLLGRSASGAHLGNPQHGLMLAMALLAAVILPPLFLEDDDLVGTAMLDQGGADRRARDERGAGRDRGAVADHQHLAELDGGTGLGGGL